MTVTPLTQRAAASEAAPRDPPVQPPSPSGSSGWSIDHSKDVHPRTSRTTTTPPVALARGTDVPLEGDANRQAALLGLFIGLAIVAIGFVMYSLGWSINPDATPSSPQDEPVIVQETVTPSSSPERTPQPSSSATYGPMDPGWLVGVQMGN